MVEVGRDELANLAMVSRAVGLSHVDLSALFGTEKPVLVSVIELHNALPRHEYQALSIHWDEDKTVTLKREDGTFLASFTVVF